MKTAVFGVILALMSAIALGQGADLSGTWSGKASMTDGTPDGLTLVLKKQDNTYTGTVTDTLGHCPAGTSISSFVSKQNEVKITFTIAEGLVITVNLTVDGDKMKGRWEDPEGGSGSVELSRKKP